MVHRRIRLLVLEVLTIKCTNTSKQNTFFMTVETGIVQLVKDKVLVMKSIAVVKNVKPLTANDIFLGMKNII